MSIRSALFRRPRKPATSQPQSTRDLALGERRDLSLLIPGLWAVGPSALPCAGAAPPQRPPLASHRVHSSPAMRLANSVCPPFLSQATDHYSSPWTNGIAVAVAVLRDPSRPFADKRCCSCRSPRPSASSADKKGVAVAVLRDPSRPFADKRCCSCRSPWPSVSFVDKKVLQLQFFATLRAPSRTKDVAVAVLRGPPFVDKRCCRCPSPRLREKPPPPSH